MMLGTIVQPVPDASPIWRSYGTPSHSESQSSRMPGSITFVVDTNLFHECKSLDAPDFPWSDIGDFDVIELIVCDTVQTELDDHKKDTRPRIKRRAVTAVSWFRGILMGEERTHVFRDAAPRVILRLSAQAPSRSFPDQLDLTVNDDKIVGVAVALKVADPNADIRVLSHDTRPNGKADAVGLAFKFTPETWLREPEQDDHQRETASLRAEIAELKSSHPILTIDAIGAVQKRVTLTRTAGADLSQGEETSIREQLLAHFSISSIEAISEKAAAARRPGSFEQRYGQYEHIRPTEEEIARFREQTYPAWIANCLAICAQLPAQMRRRTNPGSMRVTLANTGFRPAENLRIRFRARGPFLIAPPSERGYAPDLPELPATPDAPQGRWLRDGRPVAHVLSASNLINPILPHLASLGRAPLPRHDEQWYYDPNLPDQPVTEFELICRRFQHGAAAEPFDILVFPSSDDEVLSGALEVEVTAGNIGRAVTDTFPIKFETELVSSLGAVGGFIAGTGR